VLKEDRQKEEVLKEDRQKEVLKEDQLLAERVDVQEEN
jgi:hypothetical protein